MLSFRITLVAQHHRLQPVTGARYLSFCQLSHTVSNFVRDYQSSYGCIIGPASGRRLVRPAGGGEGAFALIPKNQHCLGMRARPQKLKRF